MLRRRRPVWSDGASGVEDVKSGVVSAVQVARIDVQHDEVALPNNKDKCVGGDPHIGEPLARATSKSSDLRLLLLRARVREGFITALHSPSI